MLSALPATTVSLYFAAWTPTLLAVPKFAVDSPAPDCSDNCTASFLPGGIELVRRYSFFLNSTLLEDGLLGDARTVQIRNAPGLLLRFKDLDTGFQFDRAVDCKLYGAALNDSIQICVKNLEESLAVAWVTCPTVLLNQKACYSNDSWTREPMRDSLMMTAFKQFATTDYDKPDFSIVNVDPTSDPILQTLHAADFRAAWDAALVPKNSSTVAEVTMINSLTLSLTFLMRLYDDFFPDDTHTPKRFLQNFVSIPQQFMIVCVQFANYSGIFHHGEFAMPEELITTATTGTSTQRFVGQTWTVWLFISTSVLGLLGIGTLYIYSLVQPTPIPNSIGVGELDFISLLGSEQAEETELGLRADDREISIQEMVRELNLSESNSWTASSVLRKRKVKLIAENHESPEQLALVVIRDNK